MSSAYPGVSVVLPILNEERDLNSSITSILKQEYPGEFEVILALGPSKDRTNEIARELHLRDSRVVLVENPTGRTANGLNAAIAKSKYPIISRIDGHAEISNTYLKSAVEILQRTDAVNVGGIMAAVGKTNFEKAVATAMRSQLGVGSSRFHIGGSAGPSDTVYLGTFKKDALVAAGGYDERFTRAQDWELNYRIRKTGGKIWFNPELEVIYRPRPNIKKLANQESKEAEKYRFIRSNISTTDNQNSKSIVIAGVGEKINTSLIASNIALSYARSGKNTLFQQAIDRLQQLRSPSIKLNDSLIVTNEEHRFLVLDQLREIKNTKAIY